MREILFIVIIAIITFIFVGCSYQSLNKPAPKQNATGVEGDKATIGDKLRDLGTDQTGLVVAKMLQPHLWAWLGICVIGALALVFKGKAAGLYLMVIGCLMKTLDVNLIQHTWTALIAFVAFMSLVAISFVVWAKERKLVKLNTFAEITTEVVQTTGGGKEVREGYKQKGPETVDLIDSVVLPIKRRLKRTGKLKE